MKRKLYSIFNQTCPVCNEGKVFKYKQMYDFKKFDQMYERCPHCDHKFEIETGFWYGAMYVSYALTVAFSVAAFILTYLFYPKAGPFVYFGMICLIVVGFVPVTFRWSRMIWMNFFSTYNEERAKLGKSYKLHEHSNDNVE